METPKNQHQQVIWYLLNWQHWFSLKDVINDSMFYKFQSRLGEIEREHGTITNKKSKSFTNRFGRTSSYNVYTAIDRQKLKELYNKLKTI